MYAMPDLSLSEAHAFWLNYDDPSVYRVICFMESIEDWTLDGDEALEHALETLGESFDSVESMDLEDKSSIIELGAFLKTSRVLRLLQVLDTLNPGAASKCLLQSEEMSSTHLTADLFLRRNVAFERLRLLHRMMSNDRLTMVQQALENQQNET